MSGHNAGEPGEVRGNTGRAGPTGGGAPSRPPGGCASGTTSNHREWQSVQPGEVESLGSLRGGGHTGLVAALLHSLYVKPRTLG